MKESKKISFEDYNIEFTDDDLEGVDINTLKECKEKLEKAIQRLENK